MKLIATSVNSSGSRYVDEYTVVDGTTLRDEFAMAALPSFSIKGYTFSEIAHECYSLADAMLAERKLK